MGSVTMPSPTTEIEKQYTLKTSDGETFVVDESVAMMSQTIKHIIEDNCAEGGIPLGNVTSTILAKVIEYCKKHIANPKVDTDDLNAWDKEFMKVDQDTDGLNAWDKEFMKVDQYTIFGLIMAANYLDIKSLLDLGCRTVADMMRGKTPEEIRKIFHIHNDYTPEEEEEVRRQNAWAFE